MPNNNKKTFVYSSDQTRQLCEGLLKDRAIADRSTESYLIENAILDALAPTNRTALAWVELMYEGEPLSNAYARAFSYLATGTMWEAKHNNGLPLVTAFCNLTALGFYRFTGEEKELPHLIQQLDTISEMIPANDPWRDHNLCRHIIDRLQNDPADVIAADITNLIHRNWETIGNNTRTYRALMDIACIASSTVRDTPYTRTDYINALAQTSKAW